MKRKPIPPKSPRNAPSRAPAATRRGNDVSLRRAAKEAFEGTYQDAARTALVDVLGDPEGYVTALTVEHLSTGPASSLTVFTDGDIHLGVRTYTDGRPAWVGLVRPGGGVWVEQVRVESLAHLGELLPKYDPTDENAAPAYPAWVQPTGAHDAYALGAKVTHNGKTWESTADANVWEPGVSQWREVVA